MNGDQAAEGHGSPKCGAKKRQGSGYCRTAAGWGTDHVGHGRCRLHGGSTRNQRKAAAETETEERARAILAQLDVQPCEDPLIELQLLAGQVLAWRDAIGQMVSALTEVRYEGEHGEQLRAEVSLFERALDRCERVLVSIAKLNLDERLVRISEAQARLVNGVIHAALADIGLTPEQLEAARPAIGRHLRVAAREPERLALTAPTPPGGG